MRKYFLTVSKDSDYFQYNFKLNNHNTDLKPKT